MQAHHHARAEGPGHDVLRHLIIEQRGGLAYARERLREPCARCGDTGQAWKDVDGVVYGGRCRCRLPGDRARLFNEARFPARFQNASFESWETVPANEPMVQGIREWAAGWPRQKGLLLTGDVGRGKTHLLVAIARQLILEHGVRVRFVEFSFLLGDLKRSFNDDSVEDPLAGLADVDVLIIDELGKGRASGLTEWEASICDELVSRRYNSAAEGHVLLAATNYGSRPAANLALAMAQGPQPSGPHDIEQHLAPRVGPRAWSRLREMVTVIPIHGDDMRALPRQQGVRP